MLGSLTIEVAGDALPAGPSREVGFAFYGPSAPLSIHSRRFHARRRIAAHQCTSGVVEVEVHPRPGVLRLLGVPTDVAVTCVRGCPDALLGRNYLAHQFPPIEMGTDIQTSLELQIRHPDFESLETTVALLPGINEVSLRMRSRCG